MTRRVVVVGGGIAGLATAYRLLHGEPPRPQVTVLEAGPRPGGKVRSVDVGPFELEAGPDSFVARKPWAVELCRDLVLAERLIQPAASGAYIWTDRGLVPFPRTALGVPADVDELARWKGMSRRGRLRALADLVRKPGTEMADESIGSLARRRLGDEAAAVLVGPLLGGLFAGDADRLSVRASFPELEAWERDHGSLIRGARAALRADPAGDGAAPMFLSLDGGIDTLIRALVEALGPERVVCDTPVTAIRPEGGGFAVASGSSEWSADAVVLAAPAFVAAHLVRGLSDVAAEGLARIPYASTAVVLLVYPDGTGDALPDATGFVVPRGKASMTACTWVSRKWPRDQFGRRAVLRCFVGGVGAEDILEAPDRDIIEGVCRHLAAVLSLPEVAEWSRVVRWDRAMPQYEVGHLNRVESIERVLPPGIFVVGSAYRGVGIADCVRGAAEAPAALRAYLAEAATMKQETVT